MKITVRQYRSADLPELCRIWNQVVETADDRWGAFVMRLGTNQIDEAAESLLRCSEHFARNEASAPEFLCVVCGMSFAAYRRPDGVYVVPLTALRD